MSIKGPEVEIDRLSNKVYINDMTFLKRENFVRRGTSEMERV